MGFLYNGPRNDLGYNQAHAEGKQALNGLPWAIAREEASVPKAPRVEESMRNMIHHDHAKAIFATSYGFLDPSWSMWRNKIQKFNSSTAELVAPGKHPSNIGIYFGFIDEVEYLSGMVAGV